ncbi:aminotransferase class V-fold PLP-dependent enzyme [bacterium 210820-DFI.6.37]|nr:aminotransferase class V-fold PLP-dependent enzyme [bacterium 210820-DFI.6.37]
MIYLDYAATSGPKPEEVYRAVDHALRNASGNPGRSGHRLSLAAGKLVMETRALCSRFFHAESADSICFCSNGTDALNLAIHGALRRGDHVITSSLEHNSVARPLEHLKQFGVEVTKLDTCIETGVDPQQVADAIKSNTRLVIISHVSNVTGTVSDIEAIGKVCREKGVLFLVDAAQSAGARKIDVQKMRIDLLAFPGHKCLYGPQGTGGLYVRPGISLKTLKQGGTGSRSELLRQPEDLPDKYESGTLNVPGIAGLGAGIQFLLQEGQEKIEAREAELTNMLIDGLRSIDGVRLYGPKGPVRGPVVSLTIDGYDPQDISIYLDQVFDIAVRSGLHCAPDAHRTIGTLEKGGTVRISPGYFTTEEEIAMCVEGIGAISRGEV